MRHLVVVCVALFFVCAQRAEAADLGDCNNIAVEVGAQCDVEVAGGCKTRCEEVEFVTTCVTKRYKACRDECKIEPPSVDCTGSCQASCEADCDVNLGMTDCQATCHSSCQAECKADCEATDTSVDCAASCRATCSNECYASCKVVPPSADCKAGCEASCEGSCKITAPYIECQTKCQEKEYQDCETEMKGGCETQCEQPEGALFCDGYFVDHGDNLDKCVTALNELLTSRVELNGETTIECDQDGVCTLIIEGKVSAGCSVTPSSVPPAATVIGLLLLGFVVRRRR